MKTSSSCLDQLLCHYFPVSFTVHDGVDCHPETTWSLLLSHTIIQNNDMGDSFFPSSAAIGVGLPFLIILASYGAIWYQIKKIGKIIKKSRICSLFLISAGIETRKASVNRASSIEVTEAHSIMQQTSEREEYLSKCFIYIFVTFVCCFTPWEILITLDPYHHLSWVGSIWPHTFSPGHLLSSTPSSMPLVTQSTKGLLKICSEDFVVVNIIM